MKEHVSVKRMIIDSSSAAVVLSLLATVIDGIDGFGDHSLLGLFKTFTYGFCFFFTCCLVVSFYKQKKAISNSNTEQPKNSPVENKRPRREC